MIENIQFQIDLEAAKALTLWKAQFADEVCEQAKQFATESSQPASVTMLHYRRAAKVALQSLSDTIHDGDTLDAEQKAA